MYVKRTVGFREWRRAVVWKAAVSGKGDIYSISKLGVMQGVGKNSYAYLVLTTAPVIPTFTVEETEP